MADTVDTKVIMTSESFRVFRITNESDGTGEAAVIKLNLSDFTAVNGIVPVAFDIHEIDWSVHGMNYVSLEWDATTNDEIAILRGNGYRPYQREGGALRDPLSAGATGDIVLTTDGHVDGSMYDIKIIGKFRAAYV